MSKHHSHQRKSSIQPNRRHILQGAGALAATAAIAPRFRTALAQDAVTLDYWNWWDVERADLMDAIIADFQEEFPSIVVNNVPQTWDRRDEVVTTALAGGDPPEIIMASRQEIVKFADAGAIAPITRFVETEGLDLDRYYPSEIASMWWNEELYALPMPTAGGETGQYFYNVQMFEEAGLDPENPPKTWAELDEATGALTQLSDNGALDIPGSDLTVSSSEFLAQLYCNNGSLYSDDMKSIAWNSPEGVETLTWLFEYVQRHFGGHQNVLDWINAIQPGERRFDQGRLAIEFQNVSAFFQLKNNAPDLNYGVALRPYNSDNPDAASHGVAALSFGWGYIMPSSLDEATQEAAFKFIKRITYDDAAADFMLQQERPSPLMDANENPEYREINPHWDTVLESMENDISVGIVPPQSEILSVLADYVELVAFEEMSPEEGLNTAAEEAQAILDEYWSSAS